MDELVKIKNEGYARYEELLLERDKLRKEAYLWNNEYIAEFGEMITALFEKKIECIKKKKMISFCQAAANKGKAVDLNAMHAYLEQEMHEYNKQLKQMIAENEAAQSTGYVSEQELTKIKKLYRKLAMQLHPDINPKTNDIPELQNLWHMIVVSYNANQLQDLEEAEVLVNKVLVDIGLTHIEVDIPDIAEKITKVEEEIVKIKTTNPYQYQYFLSDAQAVKEKKEALAKEQKEYEDYAKELDKIASELITSGVNFLCKMD